MRAEGLENVPLVVGGIIPLTDENVMKQMGVAKVNTPKDFKLNGLMGRLWGWLRRGSAADGSAL